MATKTRKSVFDSITDWPAFAKECQFHVGEAAARFKRKVRTLEQYFEKHRQKFPHPPKQMFTYWMEEWVRRERLSGKLGKHMVESAGYAREPSLTRALKRTTGHGLRGFSYLRAKRNTKR